MKWRVPKIWDDGTCWIIGGGPSVTTQFDIPVDIVEKVHAKQLPVSAYSPFMSALHTQHVIGVNGAFRLGDWVDFCFFGDKNWYFAHKNELMNFHGSVVGCSNFFKRGLWRGEPIKYLERHVHRFGISDDPKKVCWNLNSGSAAISLAHNLGCKRIILLGFDMSLTDGTGHWHTFYKKKEIPFRKHLMGFEQIKQDAKRLGVEILNASPTSKITEFKKVTVKELL